MKILNLYAGIGGNRKNWNGKKHDITAVEINQEVAEEYKRQYPEDNVVIGDAHEYLKEQYNEFDFIWSSPPCQTHSKITYMSVKDNETPWNKDREPEYPDMKLWQEIIFLKNFFDGDWVVENVNPYYKTFIRPQKSGRHYFWTNFSIPDVEVPRGFSMQAGSSNREELEEWLGIQLSKEIYVGDGHDPDQVLRNCVHPRIGQAILNARNTKQQTLEAVNNES